MSLHNLLAGLRHGTFTRPRTTRRATRPRPATWQPRLEPLEVRLSPAVYAVTGTADTLISEAAIRAMYRHWRAAMEL